MTTKFYKNPARVDAQAQASAYKPYVPQYRLRGLEPEDFTSNMEHKKFNTTNVPLMIKGTPDMFGGNANVPPSIGRNVPFAEVPPAAGNTNMPNVGNNVENTWAGLDGDVVDDLNMSDWSGTQHMIDNNDYVDIENISTRPIPTPPQQEVVVSEQASTDLDLQDEQYLLAIDDAIIAIGSLEAIEKEVKDLVFGDHELCGGKQIPVEDIIVLKKLKIKMGVFIDG